MCFGSAHNIPSLRTSSFVCVCVPPNKSKRQMARADYPIMFFDLKDHLLRYLNLFCCGWSNVYVFVSDKSMICCDVFLTCLTLKKTIMYRIIILLYATHIRRSILHHFQYWVSRITTHAFNVNFIFATCPAQQIE